MFALFCFTIMAHDLINIPKKLLSTNKQDKAMLELNSFALIIKCVYGDSKLKNVSIDKVKQLLHCGHNKAKRILEEAKSNKQVFKYNSYTNCLTAKSFRRAYKEVSKDIHGRTIYSMYVIKFKKRSSYSLREVVKELRKSLFLSAVNAVERADQFQSSSNSNVFSSSKEALTQRKIANITGVSRSSVSRMIGGMKKEGSIKVNRTHLRLVSPTINDDTIKAAKMANKNVIVDYKNGFIYSIVPNTYNTTSREQTKRFTNIIFNHVNRYTNNPSKKSKTDFELFLEGQGGIYG